MMRLNDERFMQVEKEERSYQAIGQTETWNGAVREAEGRIFVR